MRCRGRATEPVRRAAGVWVAGNAADVTADVLAAGRAAERES